MQLDPVWLAAQGPDARLLGLIHSALRGATGRIGVAVSGGGDSTALLHLVSRWAAHVGAAVQVVTVDHTLRHGSADEARSVADFCAALGLRHDTLVWDTWDGHGNVQAAARTARYGLMSNWARAAEVATICLGHTQDDVAESYLMRLSRKAGIDGLAEMDRQFRRSGLDWCRPLLPVSRADLRDYLARQSLGFVDDPSNDDVDFERVRARQAVTTLADFGLTAAALQHAAQTARTARDALDYYTATEARRHARLEGGDIILTDLSALPTEMRRRLWAKSVQWMSRNGYPPRASTIQSLQEGLSLNGQATGAGCLAIQQGRDVRIAREPNAVKTQTAAAPGTWDQHWQVSGPAGKNLEIRPLGEAITQCPDWRETGMPRAALRATPAVWDGDTLIAAPVAGLQNGWTARIVADFHTWLDAH